MFDFHYFAAAAAISIRHRHCRFIDISSFFRHAIAATPAMLIFR